MMLKNAMLYLALVMFFMIGIMLYTCDSWGQEITTCSVTLAWDQNPEADLAGYVIAWGTDGETYPDNFDVPLSSLADVSSPTVTIPGLLPGEYFFVALAYDAVGNQSGYSNVVEHDVVVTRPTPVTGFTVGSNCQVIIININP